MLDYAESISRKFTRFSKGLAIRGICGNFIVDDFTFYDLVTDAIRLFVTHIVGTAGKNLKLRRLRYCNKLRQPQTPNRTSEARSRKVDRCRHVWIATTGSCDRFDLHDVLIHPHCVIV